MKLPTYETIYSGNIGAVDVRVHRCLGWAECEVMGVTYTILGTSDNPNHWWKYNADGERSLMPLDMLVRNITRTPPSEPLGPEHYRTATPVIAALKQAKGKARNFAEHWKEAENHEEIAHELRRRLSEARSRADALGGSRPGLDDEIIAIESWLGSEEVLGKPAREAAGYAPKSPPPEPTGG